MSQKFGIEISHPTKQIDDFTVGVDRHCVYRQVTTTKVFLQCHSIPVVGKVAVAIARTDLLTCQGIFFFGLRMQEHRKVPTNLSETLR
ncbi:hypothetical protein D3C86_1387360 [compost metagenome]